MGNWTSAIPTDYISTDIYLHKSSGSYISGYYVFKIKGPGGEASTIVDAQPTLDDWTSYTAFLDPQAWTIISGDWNSLLEEITDVIIRAEYISGDEYVRIDNVNLSISPEIIPVIPSICSDFDDGAYDGWSFVSTGGVTNSVFEGRPGRSIKITDGSSGYSLAYPPAKYLGDWTQLDDHAAEIIFDLIIIPSQSAIGINGDYFIRISGPDGSAIFPMNNAYLEAINQWNTFTFSIDESYWAMESGTWNELLNWVNHLEIVVEFYVGSEVVWLDNFCISNSAPIADFTIERQIEFVGNPITFTDVSQYGPTSWLWDFGDIQTSTEKNPVYTFQTGGTFDVELKVNNYFGVDSILKTDYLEIIPIDQCLKFEDNFNEPEINPTWITKNGTWSISDSRIRQSSNYYVSDDLLDACYALTGSLHWENYLLSCDLYSTDNDLIGFVFDWQDDQDMYMFYWNLQDSERKLVKWVDGNETILASDDIPYATSTWYNFKILSNDGNLVISIDEDEIFSVYDDTFNTGKAGLYCWGNQSSYWDNFKVECSDSDTFVIPAGWSGISSFIIPTAGNLESMFNPILSDLVILQNTNGMFWPGQNVNTLGNWNTHEGYQIKVANAIELTISGSREDNLTLQLAEGWNLIPVLSECEADVAELFIGTEVTIVKEVAGNGIYWPEFGINSLQVLEPGKAYFVLMSGEEGITFPECTPIPAFPLEGEGGEFYEKTLASRQEPNGSQRGGTPLSCKRGAEGEVIFTPITHTIAIPLVTVSGIQTGDIIGAFDAARNCFGVSVYKNQNTSITLFGDDPTTSQKDGFNEDEQLAFRLYRPSNGEKFDLEVSYENRFDNSGLFHTNGISVVKNVKASSTGVANLEFSGVRIYPNPTSGMIHITGIEESSSIKIFNAFGEQIKHNEILTSNEVDLSGQPKGVYFIRIESEKGSYFEKIIIQ
nr:T9SS type A sorting domain-containing protein [Bacteroidota bacterium]